MLTKEEKEIYEQKKELVYKRIPLSRKLSPVIHSIINKGLIELVKNKNYYFINDMYIDYIEFLVASDNFKNYTKAFNTNRIYYHSFNLEDEELYKKALHYTRFLATRARKIEENNRLYYELYRDKGYYKNNWDNLDNKIIFDLFNCYDEIKGPYEYGEDYVICTEILQKIMAYIMIKEELLLDSNLYQEILNYAKIHYLRLRDHVLMNYPERYETDYRIISNSFNPKNLVDEYFDNKGNKKLIK